MECFMSDIIEHHYANINFNVKELYILKFTASIYSNVHLFIILLIHFIYFKIKW